MIKVLWMLAFAVPGLFVGPALAQQADSAVIQMRPDEAFWNAIRDSGNAQSFELFIATHPDSPYVADAKAALAALDGGAKATVASEAPKTEPAATRPTLDDVLKALAVLDLDPEIPDGQAPEERFIGAYIAEYRDSVGRDTSADVTDAELHEITFMAESAPAWQNVGYGEFVLGEVLARLRDVHEKLIGTPPADVPELVNALQNHFNTPTFDVLSEDLLWAVLNEPVTLPYVALPNNQEFGDWALRIDPKMTYLERTCTLFPRPDRLTWQGPLLSYILPAAPRFVYTEGSGASMSISYAPGDLFSDFEPVAMRAGGREFPLLYVDDGLFLPKYDEPTQPNGDYIGAGVLFLKRASGPVTLSGTSRWGIPLEVTFSADGFTKGFQAMNEQCADGQLDGWLR